MANPNNKLLAKETCENFLTIPREFRKIANFPMIFVREKMQILKFDGISAPKIKTLKTKNLLTPKTPNESPNTPNRKNIKSAKRKEKAEEKKGPNPKPLHIFWSLKK